MFLHDRRMYVRCIAALFGAHVLGCLALHSLARVALHGDT